MGFWTKSVRIFKSLCEKANQSIRQLASETGMSKSSVHRLKQAIARRDRSPESWLWETEEGRRWLMRLLVATLYTSGSSAESVSKRSANFSRMRVLRRSSGVHPRPCAG